MATYAGNMAGGRLTRGTTNNAVHGGRQPLLKSAEIIDGVFEDLGPGHNVPITVEHFDGNKATHAGDVWYDRIHILPKSKFEFGNILGQTTQEFEIFSAYRNREASLNSIANGLGDGSSVPAISVGARLDPFASFIDAASGRLVPVRTEIVIEKDGVPTFDGTIDFSFSTGDQVAVAASGNRIAVFPFRPESKFDELIEFRSDVLQAMSGREQRLGLRTKPRQMFSFEYRLIEDSRQRMQVQLQGWQSNLWALPMFHNGTRSTASAAFEATSIDVQTTLNRDFRVGGQAVVFISEQVQEVVTITAVTATTIEFANTPLQRVIPTNTEVFPARLCYIRRIVDGERHAVNLETFRVFWQVWDNDTGAMAASTGSYGLYNGRPVFDKNAMGSDTIRTRRDANVRFVDNMTGKVKAYSRETGRHKKSMTQGFYCHSRQEIIELQQLLMFLNGKQGSFYMPSQINDLTLSGPIDALDQTIDVVGLGLERYLSDINNPHRTLKLTFTNGAVALRNVVGATKVTDNLDRVSLDAAVGVSATVEEVESIEWVDKVRFDVDRFTIRYERPAQAVMIASVKTIYE